MKRATVLSAFRRCLVIASCFLVAGLLEAYGADSDPKEETAIRKLIAQVDENGGRDTLLPDIVFWSGAYKRPVVGHEDEKPKRREGEGAISDRVAGTQKVKTTPVRIVVADSKDLAYEYSTFTLEYTTKAGKQVKFDGAGLRVWQKQGGEWKQAVMFVRPYEE